MAKIKKVFESPLVYKIIADILILVLVTTTGVLTAETLIPGVISMYISPLTVFAILFLLIFIISLGAHAQGISISSKKNKKTLFIISVFIFALFTAIASFRYGLTFGSLTTVLSIIVYILLYKSLQETLEHE